MTLKAAAFNPFSTVCSQQGASASAVCGTNGSDPLTGSNGIIIKAARALGLVTGFIAIVVIIIGGFQFIMSNGDSSRTNTARNTIIYAAIGLVVIVLSESLVAFLVSRVR